MFQPSFQHGLERAQFRRRLPLSLINRIGLGIKVFLDGIAGQVEVAGYRADALALDLVAAAYLADGFHADHSRLLQPKSWMMAQPGWSKLDAVYPGFLVSFAR